MTSDKAVGIYGVKLVAEVDTAATEIKAKLTVSCFIQVLLFEKRQLFQRV